MVASQLTETVDDCSSIVFIPAVAHRLSETAEVAQ